MSACAGLINHLIIKQFQIIELPAVRRTQPSTKRPKFLQQPMSNCYNGYMVNNNNNNNGIKTPGTFIVGARGWTEKPSECASLQLIGIRIRIRRILYQLANLWMIYCFRMPLRGQITYFMRNKNIICDIFRTFSFTITFANNASLQKIGIRIRFRKFVYQLANLWMIYCYRMPLRGQNTYFMRNKNIIKPVSWLQFLLM